MTMPPADKGYQDQNSRMQRQLVLFLPLISLVYGGFLPAGHAHDAARGFSLDHTELVMSASIDPYFRGYFNLALLDEDVEIEEADQDEATGDPGDAPAALPIRMLHDRVLVDPDDEAGERRSTGGIVIPATVQTGGTTWTTALFPKS